MVWTVCLIISIAILLFVIGFAVVCKTLISKSKKKNIKVFNWIIAAVFLSAGVAFYPIYFSLFDGEQFDVFKSVVLSLHNAIRLFVVDADYTFIIDNVTTLSNAIKPFYTVHMAILFLLSPIFTFGFILSFFKNLSATLKYYFSYFNDVYIFSELNEKSLTLAKSLKESNHRRVIVFCDVFENNEEKSFELVGEAKEIRAICFQKDILNVNFRFHSSKRAVYFFAIGEDRHENVNHALKLGEKYKNVDNSNLYIFSNDIGSELLLSTINDGKMKVRRINEAQSLINRELYYNPGKIFSNAVETADGDKNISAVIVGMGGYGIEMLKTLVWFGQMDGYKIKINAIDQSPDAEAEFAMQCPEILDPKYNRVKQIGEAYYDVTVHSSTSVDVKDFVDKIKNIADATYVFVSLGSDEKNIKVAVELRTIFERMHIKPIIQAVVYNSGLATSLQSITNYRGQKYDIDFIGDFESIYSEAVIIDSPLEDEALRRHLKWGNEEDFWKYEYNYRSSVASAIHMRARIACNIPGADKCERELTKEERDIIENVEHCRWNAYMRAQGYVYSGLNDKASRNDLGKMHNDLVAFEELSDEDKRKDSRVGSK